MDIYEDTRTVSRADLAAWLRQLASQLDDNGQVFYGAGGAISVADQVRCELEIEQEDTDEFAIEIEFSWTNPKQAAGPASQADQPVDTDAAADDVTAE
ncbi:amphi-Trp domain-containing protein [Solwaraspora sp. WMMD406]|uniref:amphi-Trp domain-containing protein n=1 Tax=Solwaraspora sp. WMMD406 TaxID=3016095 RepID=UPI0024177834|nr:amphi-Trp domain-containing protein [Solwaraspora sp. WMMD406]MDG4762680.1 amphi-Trp domain-containing protein [Solwaraspora sp. WMMD406]